MSRVPEGPAAPAPAGGAARALDAAALAAERWAAPAIVLYTLALLAVTLFLHPTPLYSVETDLLGQFIPAARELAAGLLIPDHFTYHGVGYPLMLAALAPLFGGDYDLAARVLSVLATGAAAWLAWRLARAFAGPAVALFALAALLANPTLVRYAIEAGTDAPTLAVALAATCAVLCTRSPRALLAAGLAAGLATVMRYNSAFLIPAAALVVLSRPGRWRGLAWYALGVALPLGAWLVIDARMTGHAFQNNNYLNIAYDLYGRDLPRDQFEAEIGSRFHSLRDVIAYDPLGVAGRAAWNLGSHFVSDLHALVPPWLGVLAGPGLLLGLTRRGWRAAAIHVVLCALTLAPVYYLPRHGMYLLPFYLAGAGLLSVEAAAWIERRRARAAAPGAPAWAGVGLVALAAALVLLSGAAAALELRRHLGEAPHEVRVAGEALRRRGLAGGAIMARKPHVAYFAGMRYVSMGLSRSLSDLLAQARAAHAEYLFYSPIERIQRPEYAVLADSGLALPGLAQVEYRSWGGQRFYAVYHLTGEVADSAAMAAALERAVLRSADRPGAGPEAQVFAAMQLLQAGRHREALDRLLALERAGARDPAVAKLASTAALGVGDLDAAERQCRLAMSLEPATAWHYARLGEIRERQKSYGEAHEWYRLAVEREPGNPRLLESLGFMCVAMKDYRAAGEAFERGVRLDPHSARARRYAMGAWQLAGDLPRARAILAEGMRLGIPAQEMLDPDAAHGAAPAK